MNTSTSTNSAVTVAVTVAVTMALTLPASAVTLLIVGPDPASFAPGVDDLNGSGSSARRLPAVVLGSYPVDLASAGTDSGPERDEREDLIAAIAEIELCERTELRVIGIEVLDPEQPGEMPAVIMGDDLKDIVWHSEALDLTGANAASLIVRKAQLIDELLTVTLPLGGRA